MWRLALRVLPAWLAVAAALVTVDAMTPAGRAVQDLPPLQPIPLYPKALGPFTRQISTANRQAQAYFDQGMQMMYAFDTSDAGRSFREAQRHDPDCAICFWGEAWSWGSYLNAPMPPRQAPFAYAAIQRAIALAPADGVPSTDAVLQ